MTPFRAGDVVVMIGRTWSPMLVLSAGPKTFDVIECSGGTSRHRQDAHSYRLATFDDFSNDATSRERFLRLLTQEATSARAERKRGARVKRGLVSPRK